jgi:hypothetical protein
VYWELLAEENIPIDLVDSIYERLMPLYMINNYTFGENRSNAAPKKIQTEIADKLTVWADTGAEYQRLAALAILAALDVTKAREVAERLDTDTTLSDELRFDAFQIRLATQANVRARTEFTVETLKQKDLKRSRRAIRSLVGNDDHYFQVLRNRLYVHLSSSAFVSPSSRQNTQLVPQGLELETIQPLLTDENEEIAAYAGYFAALLGDATGMEPLLAYWQKTKVEEKEFEDDEHKISVLVYRAIGTLDDSQYLPVLREIYGRMQEVEEVRDFYWSIRNMSGAEILAFRREIRDTHGIANLQ